MHLEKNRFKKICIGIFHEESTPIGIKYDQNWFPPSLRATKVYKYFGTTILDQIEKEFLKTWLSFPRFSPDYHA